MAKTKETQAVAKVKEVPQVPALAEKYTDSVEMAVRALREQGQIDIPVDYSVSNALRSAYLILQETENKDHKPALECCTPTSITNAIMTMVTEGLNPSKNQGYFICYGNKLVWQRSYFGSIALAKRANPNIVDIVCEPIYEDDTITIQIMGGVRTVSSHEQSFDSISEKDKIKGGYAMAIDRNGEVTKSVIMTMKEIKECWKKSRNYPIDQNDEVKPGSVHKRFTARMVRRTVMGRLCREIINTSSDSALLKNLRRFDAEKSSYAVEAETTDANTEFVDIEPEKMPEKEAEAKTGSVGDVKYVDSASKGVEDVQAFRKQIEGDWEPEGEQGEVTEVEKPKGNNPGWVADTINWLAEVAGSEKELRGRIQMVEKDSVPRMTDHDKEEVRKAYTELLEVFGKAGLPPTQKSEQASWL